MIIVRDKREGDDPRGDRLVAGAETGRPHLLLRQERPGKPFRTGSRHGNFKPVLLGIAASCHGQRNTIDHTRRGGHKEQIFRPRRETGNYVGCQRSLKSEQGAVELFDFTAAATALKTRQIYVAARRVHDQEQMVPHIGHHKIVDDAACIVGKLCITYPAVGQ